MNKRKINSQTGTNSTQDASQEPTAFNEKRKKYNQPTYVSPSQTNTKEKRFSRNLNDLSMLNDLSLDQSQGEGIKPACAGVIEKISLKNFKCHSLLKFELHPYINFILGRNGSGKSSVMDGITLCLGGRAASTGRQASAKTFIKTNCDRAELSLTLINKGEEAYKSSEYGSKITIERKINKDGNSSYKLLNDRNKVISTKKSEVDNIRENFNIQIDNPVCFLNQETSKHFLNSSNKSDKYQFFMKASQIDSIKKIQESIEDQRQISVNIIQQKKQHLPKLEEELYKLNLRYEKSLSVDRLRRKLTLLCQEYSWAVVINCEKMLATIVKEKQSLTSKNDKLQAKLNESEKNFAEINTHYEEIKLSITDLAKKGKVNHEEFEKASELFKKASLDYKSTQNELKQQNTLLIRKKNEYEKLKNRFDEEKKNSAKDFQEEKAQKELQIETVTKEIKKAEELEKFKLRDNQMYSSAIDHEEKTKNDLKFEIKNYEKVIFNLNEDIEKFRKSEKDRIHRFGPHMGNLVKEVKNNHQQGKFKYLPKGPIGMHVTTKDFQYSLAIEQCIGSVMNSFVCENYNDERLLHKLISKHIQDPRMKPRVIVMDFTDKIYDTSKNRPQFKEYPTVFEMLQFDDPVVANVLIDQKQIESILLLPDRTHSHIIEKKATQQCNQAYLMNGDQLLGLPSFRYFSCKQKEANFFVKSTQEAIQQKQLKIDPNKKAIEKFKNQINTLESTIDNNRKLKFANDKQIDDIKREILKLQSKLRQANSIVIPEPFDLVAFEEEMNKILQDVNEIENKIQKINENSADLKNSFDDAKLKNDHLREIIETITKETDELQKKYHHLNNERDQVEDAITHYKNGLNEILPRLDDKDKLIKEHTETVEKVTSVALEAVDRIETKRSLQSLSSECQSLEEQIAASAKLSGNEVEIQKQYLSMKNKLSTILKDIKKQEAFLERLKIILDRRNAARYSFMTSKALRCAMDFSQYLRSRNYVGSLNFNHEEQSLDVIVHPNKTKNTTEIRDLKSLSGGERSFSTVAFLLSLWSIVESPILFLDEFDVFMDQINRRFAMDLILSSAIQKLNGQYLFLTPQEMGYVKPDVHIRMFQMPDPLRAERECIEEE